MRYKFPDGIARDSVNRFPYGLKIYYQDKNTNKVVSIEGFPRNLNTGKADIAARTLGSNETFYQSFPAFQITHRVYNP